MLKYFSYKSFKNIDRKRYYFSSNNESISAFLYYDDSIEKHKDSLIVFCHGFGQGHLAYTKEIVHFLRQGYKVFAFDYSGCGASSGRSIGSLFKAEEDLKNALIFINQNQLSKTNDLIVIGHSWGGHNALCATKYESLGVKKVVSLSGFISLNHFLRGYKKQLFLFVPGVMLIDLFYYSKKRINVIKSLKNTTCKVMYVYGKKDKMVNAKTNGDVLFKKFNNKPNFDFVCFKDKFHNPYLSYNAERLFIEQIIKSPKEKFHLVDYDKVGESDIELFNKIYEFMI